MNKFDLKSKLSQLAQKHTLKWSMLTLGLGSLIWLLLRSGTKIRRLAYPCQRAALLNSLGFVGYLISLLGSTWFYRRLRQNVTWSNVVLFGLGLLVTSGLTGSMAMESVPALAASPDLKGWESATAISNVFAVTNVPVPACSLDGGDLPSTPACDTAAEAFTDTGVDNLIEMMETKGAPYFYKTTAHPNGIVGANDVVVIKVNNQWGGGGTSTGRGRLSTNTDTLKGLIWRILQHPSTFTGEIVIAENTQPISTAGWNVTPANAQDQNQSYQDVVNAFHSQGYNEEVSFYNWTDLNDNRISGGNIGDGGYPVGEYANGNNTDAYIMLEDPAKTATNEYSYPKFKTVNNTYVSMRYGVWNGSSYNSDRLTFINMPVLKIHGMAGATAAWKNLIGFVNADGFGSTNRYDGDWNTMHDYYWGFGGGSTYGLIGREIALIRPPDLHFVDAIWVATQSNYDSNAASRQDVLLASSDPFAVDWYASEYVLYPLVAGNTSAARNGIFRNATRVNQNSARLVWPGGTANYPYIDLLDSYNGSTPSNDEKNEMNVYVDSVPAGTSPTAQNDSATTAEDTAVTVSVLANDTASAGSLSISAVGSPAHGTAVKSGTTVIYTPAANYNGADSFTYTATDSNGSDSATVNITVTAVNDKPDARNDAKTTAEDTATTITVLANDTDPENNTLSISAVGKPAHGTAAKSGTTVTYTPTLNYNGADSFSYTINDGHSLTDTATVAITVTAVNDRPDAKNDAKTTAEDTAVTITVLANDTDPENNTLSISAVGAPGHGSATKIGTSIRYTPTANYNGADSFSYTINDGHSLTDTATVAITVTAVNDKPDARNDSFTVFTNKATSLSVKANDIDVDGDTLSISAVGKPAHGTAAKSGTTVTYTPTTSYLGADSFSYTINDGHSLTDTATVAITVTEVAANAYLPLVIKN